MKNKKKTLTLTTQIFIALVLAIIAGLCLRSKPEIAVNYIKPFGTIFLNLLKFIICPIVLFSMMCGITSLSNLRKVASIGWKTLLYFFVTTVLAVVIGLAVGNAARQFFPVIATTELQYTGVAGVDPIDTFVNIFPSNFLAPILEANMLQVIVMALLLGFSIVLLKEKGRPLTAGINRLNALFLQCMELILKASPVAVFCMLTPVVAENGPAVIGSLAIVLAAAYIGFAIQLVVVYGLSVKVLAGMSPVTFFKGMASTMAFAFSSASSVGSLTLNMKACEAMGARREVVSFVLPLGATINMGGTAIYMGVCSTFIAACFGITLTVPQLITIVATAVLASIGTAGVPGSGLVMLAMVLTAVGLPVEGVTLVAGVDRIFDMGRTVVNISGDSACSIIVSHSEKEAEKQSTARETVSDET